MSIDDKKRKILEDYIKSATQEERKELNRLLDSREKSGMNDLKTKANEGKLLVAKQLKKK